MEKTIIITGEIEAYKEILKNPKNYGLNMKPFNEYFVESKDVTAQHTLAEKIQEVNKAIPKLVIYLLFADSFGTAREVDENGDLGYRLSFCSENNSEAKVSKVAVCEKCQHIILACHADFITPSIEDQFTDFQKDGFIVKTETIAETWARGYADYAQCKAGTCNDFNEPKQVCYKTNEPCKYDCQGLCKESC